MTDSTLEAVLRRDRLIVASALGVIAALAWAYVLWLAVDMEMGGMEMSGFRMVPAGTGMMAPAASPWSAVELAFVFVMWAVMMVGMMAPSAAPMILLYARVGRQARAGQGRISGRPFAATGWFASGYFLAWAGFSLAATLVQWLLERWALLDARMASANTLLGAAVLIAAGLYQWMPIKNACLSQCQTPFQFLMIHGGFRSDALGCVRLGLLHGTYCVGCCWVLMAVLFVVRAARPTRKAHALGPLDRSPRRRRFPGRRPLPAFLITSSVPFRAARRLRASIDPWRDTPKTSEAGYTNTPPH
jgi:predicted metal-binding membrane protein